MNNITKVIYFSVLSFTSFLSLSTPAKGFSLYLENQTNNDYTYTVELDSDDSLVAGDRLILTGLSGVTDAAASSPYNITSSDFDATSANFMVDTPVSGAIALTGVISLTSADTLDNLAYQGFYTDNGTPRVSNNNVVAVPFNSSTDLGILLLLSGFGCSRLIRKFARKSNDDPS